MDIYTCANIRKHISDVKQYIPPKNLYIQKVAMYDKISSLTVATMTPLLFLSCGFHIYKFHITNKKMNFNTLSLLYHYEQQYKDTPFEIKK